MSPRLVVITVNYCCAAEILDGLDATMQQVCDLGGEFWIVDNQSPDTSLEELRTAIAQKPYADHVTLIESDRNGGFGYGNNVAIRKALAEGADYLYFLNPDAIPEPGAIEQLIQFLEARPDVGAVGSQLYDEDGHAQVSMFRFPSFQSEVDTALQLGLVSRLLRASKVAMEIPSAPTSVDWITGASFMVRRPVFEAAGLFDETFFLYWEEVELCHRIKQAGFDIYGLPASVVMHIGGVTTGMQDLARRKPYYWFVSRRYFFQKTGLGGPVWALDIVVAGCLFLRRIKQALLRRPMTPARFLRDFVAYSILGRKGG